MQNNLFQFENDDEIENWLSGLGFDGEERLLIADGLAKACIGVSEGYPRRMIYSKQLVVKCLMENHDLSAEEAHEVLVNGVLPANFGPETPIFADTPSMD